MEHTLRQVVAIVQMPPYPGENIRPVAEVGAPRRDAGLKRGIPRSRRDRIHRTPSMGRGRRSAKPFVLSAASPQRLFSPPDRRERGDFRPDGGATSRAVGGRRAAQGQVRPPVGGRRPGGPPADHAAVLPLLCDPGVHRLLLAGGSQRDLPGDPTDREACPPAVRRPARAEDHAAGGKSRQPSA